ncbi:MAG: hypothetical protein IIA33_07635, partial [Planctomycetes bacterium]|nr:hypothetical protein [Planctomycetota bacterium]
LVNSSEALLLGGDFDNFSVNADTTTGFDWTEGTLEMNGSSQSIEAAGEDHGPWPIGLEDNFVIGTLTLAANAVVQVIDEFDNQKDGVIACDEALYVDVLIVSLGAELLVTDGCRVYYNELINDGDVPGLGIDVLQIRTTIPADLDGNGKVGPFDLALVLGFWGSCSAPCAPEGEPATCPESCTPEDHAAICPSDISGDCDVGPFDLALVLGNWGLVP